MYLLHNSYTANYAGYILHQLVSSTNNTYVVPVPIFVKLQYSGTYCLKCSFLQHHTEICHSSRIGSKRWHGTSDHLKIVFDMSFRDCMKNDIKTSRQVK